MTPTPSSPVQAQRGTDEREPFSPWRSFDDLWAFGSDEDHALAITTPALREQLRARDEEIAGLRGALHRIEPYGYHYAACGLITGLGFECSCGLNYARSEAKAALQEKPRDAG